jgi:hypothetical protein
MYQPLDELSSQTKSVLSKKFLLLKQIFVDNVDLYELKLPLLDSYGRELINLGLKDITSLSRLTKNSDIVAYIKMAAYLQTKPEFIAALSDCLLTTDIDIIPIIENRRILCFNYGVLGINNESGTLASRLVDIILFECLPIGLFESCLPYLDPSELRRLSAYKGIEEIEPLNPNYSLYQMVEAIHQPFDLPLTASFTAKLTDLARRMATPLTVEEVLLHNPYKSSQDGGSLYTIVKGSGPYEVGSWINILKALPDIQLTGSSVNCGKGCNNPNHVKEYKGFCRVINGYKVQLVDNPKIYIDVNSLDDIPDWELPEKLINPIFDSLRQHFVDQHHVVAFLNFVEEGHLTRLVFAKFFDDHSKNHEDYFTHIYQCLRLLENRQLYLVVRDSINALP